MKAPGAKATKGLGLKKKGEDGKGKEAEAGAEPGLGAQKVKGRGLKNKKEEIQTKN